MSDRDVLASLSDAALVERSADGDTAAFAVLLRRYGPLMRAYAARILGQGDGEADDAVQEAALQAWQRIDRVDAADQRPVDEVVAARMQVRELARIVQALPDAPRAVWVMREIGGASYAEIAEATGLSQPAVRGALARARRRVLEQMEGWR